MKAGPGADQHRQAAIEVEGLRHAFLDEGNRLEVIAELNLVIPPGQFVCILGPSGCGKSTFLMHLAGLIPPAEGRVVINDKQIDRPYTDVGIVFQDPALLEWRTALRNILLQAEVRKMDMAAATAEANRLMRLTQLDGFQSSYPRQLSGGMKQRVSICRALLHRPPLLLMDEPFGALDALTREEMRSQLQSLWMAEEQTVVFVTHDIAEAVYLADTVIVFSARPARVLEIVEIPLPRPRKAATYSSEAFTRIEEKIRRLFHQHGVLDEQ